MFSDLLLKIKNGRLINKFYNLILKGKYLHHFFFLNLCDNKVRDCTNNFSAVAEILQISLKVMKKLIFFNIL